MHERSRLHRPVKNNVFNRQGNGLAEKRTVKKNWKERLKQYILSHKRKLIYLFLIFIAIMAIIPPATYLYFAQDLKDKESILNRGKTGLTLQDRNGETFYTFYQPKQITYVPISEIPKAVQEAAIATEDKNFYSNPGFSVRGIARAFFVNIMAGKVVEGGSTITQELAKNVFLSSSRNVFRKYQELVLASELNRRFSKDDILEIYLNSVYFGEGAFGIENAAQVYFGIPAKDLTLSQSAMLIGLLPAPSAYSPVANPPDKALIRQKIVLGEMVEENYITQAQVDQARSEQLTYGSSSQNDTSVIAFHFANYIKNQLIKEYGEERVIRDGFIVRTSLDQDLQTYAEQTVRSQVERLQWNNASNGAAVAIDPKTSEILAMVGSYDWKDEKFGQINMAVTPRQPGSSFKPLIYATGIENRTITASSILHDEETTFNGGYKPKNYDLSYRGDVTVRRALANSLNIPAVEVMEKVGVTTGINKAREFGITTLRDDVNYGLSLVLGTGEVPLLELTNAYAVFANNGTYIEPTGIISIKNKYDKTVTKAISPWYYFNPLNWLKDPNKRETHQVISREAAFILSSILSDNYARAEEFGRALTISRPAAVKTGTTEDYRDALTVGYTPSLVVGVWVGNNDNKPMDNIAGSLGAAPIWRSLMEKQLMGTPVEDFEKPTFVVSQPLCVNGQPTNKTEFYIAGTQPESCDYPTREPSPTIEATATPGPTEGITPAEQPTPTEILRQSTPLLLPSPTTGVQVTPPPAAVTPQP